METMSNTDTTNHLLSIRNLEVEYTSSGSILHAVNGISFDVDAGKTLGLVGETGAGKTTIAKSILRILPDHATRAVRGEIYFGGENILKVSDAEMRKVRGKKISMIFQDPMTSLNPVKTVINQIAESIKVHQKLDKAGANKKAVEILEMVGITADRADEYPHQCSGGMKQRVVIALALACSPEILIADEPTTALDVTIQAQVLDLIAKLREEIHTSMILITHDLGVVADQCDTVAVVYAGNTVEFGSKEDIFDHPSHPYTKGLFGSLPDLSKKVHRLSPVKGLPPDPTNLPPGCAFSPRCPYVTDACKQEAIKQTEISPGHFCRCCNPKFLVV
jgi:peptide/nickel transport system ATP-binding protein